MTDASPRCPSGSDWRAVRSRNIGDHRRRQPVTKNGDRAAQHRRPRCSGPTRQQSPRTHDIRNVSLPAVLDPVRTPGPNASRESSYTLDLALRSRIGDEWPSALAVGIGSEIALLRSVLHKVLQLGMAETITFRPDDDALRALAVLTKDGTTVSNALRSALIDAARVRAQEKLRSESAALAANEQDRAEAAQVLRDMETLRAW